LEALYYSTFHYTTSSQLIPLSSAFLCTGFHLSVIVLDKEVIQWQEPCPRFDKQLINENLHVNPLCSKYVVTSSQLDNRELHLADPSILSPTTHPKYLLPMPYRCIIYCPAFPSTSVSTTAITSISLEMIILPPVLSTTVPSVVSRPSSPLLDSKLIYFWLRHLFLVRIAVC